MNITTATGHITEIVVLAAFALIFAIPVYMEARKKARAPKPQGATKI